jgi:serine/threonine protein kinase
MWGKTWNKVGHWLKKEDENEPPTITEVPAMMGEKEREKEVDYNTTPTRPPRPVIPSLPRPTTFARQNSERRDKLCPVEPDPEERRAASVDRRAPATYLRRASPPPPPLPTTCLSKTHAPESVGTGIDPSWSPHEQSSSRVQFDTQNDGHHDEEIDLHPHPGLSHNDLLRHPEHLSDALDDLQIQAELEAKWILNLSMHFRDNSDREKFFITYAEEPSKWRRVTVSCDYRTMPADSLEADLKSLHYQRDKSARIYESIRDSLPDIQFYPTVTNLKLQTSDGRLHVHVTEDVNEIIQYPSVSLLRHIECRHFKESTIEFDSHLSGFVYKIRTGGRVYIKKEIPGPEAVEEFLYEANALSSLRGSPNVVQFEGIVIDDKEQVVKGLLLSYAEQGALVDLVYDYKNTEWLPWTRRERWAKQIVEGLADIHESGFVQGDFTLSNIVIDEADSARIIDINRRGCPVGWEPPELARLIQSGQRISNYIGAKSDLFQLGMVLWALAEQQDEPERQEHPLQFTYPREIPEYYHAIVKSCLSENLRDRLSAKDLLRQFPSLDKAESKLERVSSAQLSPNRSEKRYIDPATAVGLEDVDYLKNVDEIRHHSQFSASEATFADGTPSTEYLFVSSGSEMADNRGRSSARTSLEGSLPNRSMSNFRASVDKQLQQAVVETSSTDLLLHASSDAVDTHEEDKTSCSFATISPPTPASRQDSEKTIIVVKDHIELGQSSQDHLPALGSQDQSLEHIPPLEITLPSQFGSQDQSLEHIRPSEITLPSQFGSQDQSLEHILPSEITLPSQFGSQDQSLEHILPSEITLPSQFGSQDQSLEHILPSEITLPSQFGSQDQSLEHIPPSEIILPSQLGSQDQSLEHISPSEITHPSRFGPLAHQDSGFHELPIVEIVCSLEEQAFPSAGLDKHPIQNEPGQLSTEPDPLTGLDLFGESSPSDSQQQHHPASSGFFFQLMFPTTSHRLDRHDMDSTIPHEGFPLSFSWLYHIFFTAF